MEGMSIEELAAQTQPIFTAPQLQIIDAYDLIKKVIPYPKFVCDGLLPIGYTVYGGRPKKGKSISVVGSILVPVCLGLPAFGVHEVDAGEAVYVGFEETERRMQERLRKFVPMSVSLDSLKGRLHLAFNPPRQHENGLELLEQFLDSHPLVKVVCIDTMQRFAPPKKKGEDNYESEYNVGAEVFKLAQERSIAVLSITHTTKTAYADVFDCIRGTGTTSAADTVMIFEGTKDKQKRVLHIQSREMGEQRYLLSSDPDSLIYTSLGEVDDQDYKELTASEIPNGRPPKLTPAMRNRAQVLKTEDKSNSQIAKQIEQEFDISISAKTISRLWDDE